MATNTQDNSRLPQAQQASSQQPPPLPHSVSPPPLVQQHIQEHLRNQQSDQQRHQLPQFQQPQEQSLDDSRIKYAHPIHVTSLYQDLSGNAIANVSSLQTHGSTNMDPQNPQYAGSNSSNSTNDNSYSKGKEGGQGVLDGLLPRIETRGQSRGGGRHKQDDKSRGGKR
ncbi:hypothetical protein S40285_09808 [Stachybotrys chlorohalonatus IBT 40285]|uniref:Uncharacterized protein n=1 Tax=Stachybotrys chlorohalonatus (strain IBT 40285) TaxID=1283841 RepID=A0A084QZ49_STAC4|nr:hypothetical protein S40285_09808 [Stachybotrys chlorohalonata IBT 40285]